jgi:hypothetical protein
MAKRKSKQWKRWKIIISMLVYWAAYLTATMAFFEHYNINPATVPYGPVGWAVIVELPRVALGGLISAPIYNLIKK